MHNYPVEQEMYEARAPFRNVPKRGHRTRRFSAAAEHSRQIYRTFSDDQKMLIQGVSSCPYSETRYFDTIR